jgi:hypothetical protein
MGQGGLGLWAPNASLYENMVIDYLLSGKAFANGSPNKRALEDGFGKKMQIF